MNTTDIAHWRLHNQHLSRQACSTPAEAVAWMGAMQGQDYAGIKFSIGLRANTTDDGVQQALTDGLLVRTWPLRGTLHIVAAADVRWMLALMGPRTIAACARRYRELELDAQTLGRSTDLLCEALQGGAERTRTELLALLEAAGISTRGQRAAHLLQRASLEGRICQGATTRGVPLYRALDARIAPAPALTREQALALLAARYFTSHGPATVHDFAWWSGLTLADARAGLNAVRDRFVSETLDGHDYWLHPSTAQTAAPAHDPDDLILLPGFDEYLLGYRDRSAVLDPQDAQHVVPGGNGMFLSTLVLGGRVVGVWNRRFARGKVLLTPLPFSPPLTPEATQALAAAAARYGDFLGMQAEVCAPTP